MNKEQQRALAIARARQRQAENAAAMGEMLNPSTPETNLTEQGMSGVNEGIASMLGAPVDIMTSVINGVVGRPQFDEQGNPVITPEGRVQMQPPAITEPFGGGRDMNALMSPFISDEAPQTAGQRYARRIGQEVGAGAVPGALFARGAGSLGRFAAMEGASSVGAGVAGQTAREIAPNSDGLDFAASLLGGGSPLAGSMMMRRGPQAPTIDELVASKNDAYGQVEASGATVTERSRDNLVSSMQARLEAEKAHPRLHDSAFAAMDRLENNLPKNPTIYQIEQERRAIGRDVAGSADPAMRGIGVAMKEELDNYLGSLTPADVSRGGEEAVNTLRNARVLNGRVSRSAAVGDAVERGSRRAASTGTGGNEVNAIRQNIRSILDSPKKRRGYTAAEIEAMEGIVRGTRGINAMRQIGRFSPTSGALPMFNAIAAPTFLGGIGAALPVAGIAAKGGAEMATKRQVSMLEELIRNGAPVAPKVMEQMDRSLLGAFLTGQAVNAAGQ